ncbi:hypothetical protein SAMN02927924_03933 [Sphingobium faniae]|nr:hypothetical protein SAMN02927924_03933 [Sphingobium faniae]
MRRHLGVGATISLLPFSSTPLLAQVGQTLEVYHATLRHRRMVGHVQVDQIFDDHFAHFQVKDSTPQKGDWVRLKRNRS